ncbi:hypothetical protein [Streptomyces sp. NPDC057293]|uniref:hypothetical protein n=1 Tax=unclassified Streptomyces TaxID=2593676 RepID=UPI00363A1E66
MPSHVIVCSFSVREGAEWTAHAVTVALDAHAIGPRDTLRRAWAMIGPVFEGGTVQRLGLTAAVVVILSISGCNGSQGDDDSAAKPAKGDAVSASPAARESKAPERNLQQVKRDLQAAVAPNKLRMQPHRKGFCIVHGTVPTRHVLGKAEFEAIIGRMEKRGWPLARPVDHSDDETYGKMSLGRLKSGEWEILMGSTAMPPEVREAYAPNEGAITLSVSWNCNAD